MSPSLLSPADLKQLLHHPGQRHAPLVIDVRPVRHFNRGHIPGSHHFSRALLLSSELPDQDLVVIAENDQRAGELGEALHQRGFHRQIRSLHGGLPAWVQAGQPLHQAPGAIQRPALVPLALAILASVILVLQNAPLHWLAVPWAVLFIAPRLQPPRAGRRAAITRQRPA